MSDDFEALSPIVAARRHRALDTHRRNLAESRRVADELAEIDALRGQARLAASEITTHRLLGADVAWDGWLLQRRARLMQRAALARAAEMDSAAAARTALARQDAIAALAEAERQAARARRARHEEDALQALMILRADTDGDA